MFSILNRNVKLIVNGHFFENVIFPSELFIGEASYVLLNYVSQPVLFMTRNRETVKNMIYVVLLVG